MARPPATLPTSLAPPRKTYSFADFSRLAPSQPIPGDRLDTELHELRASLTAAVDVINGLLNGVIPLPTSDVTLNIPGFLGTKVVDIRTGQVDGGQRFMPVLQPLLDVTPRAYELLNHSGAAADRAENYADIADAQRKNAEAAYERASQAAGRAEIAAQFVTEARVSVMTAASQTQAIVDQHSNDDNHAALAAFDASQAEQLAWKWAEWLSGPVMTEAEYAAIDPGLIPPGYTYNPVTGMGTAGLWSSKWWAVRAAQLGDGAQDAADAAAGSASDAADSAAEAAASVDDFDDLYLGAHPTAPGTDNDGGVLQEGAMYWNSTTNQLYVWGGATWHAVTTPTGGVSASSITFAPAGNISSTNVQTAIQELDAEKVGEAPNDGGTYGRKNLGWVSMLTPTIDWGSITGKPSTFPPSPHVHPISDVTGLQTALDSETTARTNADATLQAQTTNNATAIATEATNRSNADNALDAAKVNKAGDTMTGPLNVVTPPTAGANAASKTYVDTQVATKIGDAPSNGFQYARQDGAWTTVVGGASISDTAPSTPLPGQFWWESDTGVLYVRYADPNSSQWVQVNYSIDPNSFIKKTGDTMTGSLRITPASGQAQLFLDKPASGNTAQVVGRLGSSLRWAMNLGNSSAETGANSGSHFSLSRYDDSGVAIDAPLTIARDSSNWTINANGIVQNSSTGGNVSYTLNKSASGNSNAIFGQTAGVNRWVIIPGDISAESSGNLGSNFSIGRYNDAGVYIDSTLTLNRASGSATFTGAAITINPTAATSPGFNLIKSASGQSCSIQSYTGATARWLVRIGNGTPEPGSGNGGSDYDIVRYTDAGASIDAPFTILRTNGRVQVSYDGPSKPTAGQWAATSDRRIKRSIRPYDKGLDEILKLHPVSYKFKPETGRDPDKRHVSMIAQEVEAVMPEMITKDDETLGELHFTDMRTFDPTNIQYALINAVKTLDARLSALEERI